MKFLCLCYYDEAQFKAMTPAQFKEFEAICKQHDPEFIASGHVDWVGAMAEPAEARSLKGGRGDAKVKVVDGLYHPTPEPFGAAFVVEAKDMEEAIRIARLHPGTHVTSFAGGGIEIRAFAFFQQVAGAKDQRAA